MTIKTTYICDRCGKAQPPRIETSQAPLYRLTLLCEAIDEARSHYRYIPSEQEAEWCVDCLTELKVKRPLLHGGGAEQPPTLEQIVRDIVRSEMEG
jgi:hypothetical protein